MEKIQTHIFQMELEKGKDSVQILVQFKRDVYESIKILLNFLRERLSAT